MQILIVYSLVLEKACLMLFFGISIFSQQEYRVKRWTYGNHFSVGFIYNTDFGKFWNNSNKNVHFENVWWLNNYISNKKQLWLGPKNVEKYVTKWCILKNPGENQHLFKSPGREWPPVFLETPMPTSWVPHYTVGWTSGTQ